MPIVDPGPIWEVDLSHDHTKTEFSDGLSLVPPSGDQTQQRAFRS